MADITALAEPGMTQDGTEKLKQYWPEPKPGIRNDKVGLLYSVENRYSVRITHIHTHTHTHTHTFSEDIFCDFKLLTTRLYIHVVMGKAGLLKYK